MRGPRHPESRSIVAMVNVADRAVEGLRRSLTAARRFDPSVGIRLSGAGPRHAFDLAAGPEPGDSTIEGEGYVLWVAEGISGTVDLGDHDVLVLRVT